MPENEGPCEAVDPDGRYTGAEWFRARFVRFSNGVDEWGDTLPGKGGCELRFDTFTVDRVTSKGVWLTGFSHPHQYRRFVLREANKTFAQPTKADALISFNARKDRQINILHSQIQDARDGIALAKSMLTKLRCDPPGRATLPAGDKREAA